MNADPVCSARGCRQSGVWALRWNNPRLHPPERRKTWVACEAHRGSLGEFLSLRGFLRETLPTDQLPAEPSPAQPSPAQPSPAQPSPAEPSPAEPSSTERGAAW